METRPSGYAGGTPISDSRLGAELSVCRRGSSVSTLEFYGKGYCVYLRGNIPSKELLQIANSLSVAK